jgi:hypothetical protein
MSAFVSFVSVRLRLSPALRGCKRLFLVLIHRSVYSSPRLPKQQYPTLSPCLRAFYRWLVEHNQRCTEDSPLDKVSHFSRYPYQNQRCDPRAFRCTSGCSVKEACLYVAHKHAIHPTSYWKGLERMMQPDPFLVIGPIAANSDNPRKEVQPANPSARSEEAGKSAYSTFAASRKV